MRSAFDLQHGRQIDHLADRRPLGGLLVLGEILHELVHQREEDGRLRQVGPLAVEGRRPGDDAPGPDAPLRRRHGAVVVAREHAIAGRRFERAVAIDARRREVAAARRAEDLEHRVAVIAPADGRAAAAGTLDDLSELARQQVRLGGRPDAVLAERDEQAAAAFDVAPQHFAGQPERDNRVVEDHDVALVERARADARRRRDLHVEGRRLADRERAREVVAGVAGVARCR